MQLCFLYDLKQNFIKDLPERLAALQVALRLVQSLGDGADYRQCGPNDAPKIGRALTSGKAFRGAFTAGLWRGGRFLAAIESNCIAHCSRAKGDNE